VTRVLVTAFEPFGGETVNPSAQAVAGLGVVEGATVTTAVLPVVYGRAWEVLLDAVRTHDPELVICVGQAGGRAGVTPERVAVNLDHARADDNAGQRPTEAPIVGDGPVGYFSTLPVGAIVAALDAAGITAAASSTAGHFVCNHVFYRLMHLLATERPGVRGGFVHVPWSAEQVAGRGGDPVSLPLDSIVEALRVVVRTSLVERVPPPP
jgi:pyroglutamyl-peptidase